MLSTSILTLLLAAAASLAQAQTPSGFTPGSTTPLQVSFNGTDASGGKVVQKAATATAPQLALSSPLNGTSYAILMIDLDIPTNTPPTTSTLLHWMQTGLVLSTTSSKSTISGSSANVFSLSIPSGVAAAAPYLQPAPPARIPLSHRYTQILVDTTGISAANLAVLTGAAANRTAFSAETVLTKAGLAGKVVAGNFFNVTNPGPATNAATGTGTTAANATASTTPVRAGTTGMLYRADGAFLGVALVAAVFFSL